MSDIRGGGYTAIKNADGTYDIVDVPIMAEVPKGDKGASAHVGKEWQEAAVEKAQARARAGYLPPLHVRHHEVGTQTVPAGFVLPKRVERRTYDGAPSWTTLADLKRIPEHVFKKIQNLEVPYRSVEIGRWSKPEIQSLALLEDDAPYFKFEMLTVGKVVDSKSAKSEKFQAKTPERGVVTAPNWHAILFKFQDVGEPQLDDKKKKKDANGDKGPEAGNEHGNGGMHQPAAPDAQAQANPDAPGMAPGGQQPAPAQDAGLAQTLAAIKAGIDQLLVYMTSNGVDPNDPNAELKPAEQTDPNSARPTPAPGMKEEITVANDNDNVSTEAKLMARQAASDEKIAKLEARLEKGDKLSAALKELEGRPMTDEVKAKMSELLDKDPSGDSLKIFTDTYKISVPEDPAETADEATAGAAADNDAEEVKFYADKDPKVLAAAREASKLYDEAVAHNMTSASRESFIKIQLRQAGVKV